jgi:hypothetical protein
MAEEIVLPAGFKYGNSYALYSAIQNGDPVDYFSNIRGIISYHWRIGGADQRTHVYFPTADRIREIVADNREALMYPIWKAGELLRFRVTLHERCEADFVTEEECRRHGSSPVNLILRFKVINTGRGGDYRKRTISLSLVDDLGYSIVKLYKRKGSFPETITLEDVDYKQLSDHGTPDRLTIEHHRLCYCHAGDPRGGSEGRV